MRKMSQDELAGLFIVALILGWIGAAVAIVGFCGWGWGGIYIWGTMLLMAGRVAYRIRADNKRMRRPKSTTLQPKLKDRNHG